MTAPRIHIGIGGWVFAPWRGSFYPKGLPQKEELRYAGERLTGIEINGTYYGAQKPASFARWRIPFESVTSGRRDASASPTCSSARSARGAAAAAE